MGSFANTLWNKYLITEEHFTIGSVITILWTFVSVIVMFVACLVLSLVYRLFLGKLKVKISSVMPEIRCD